MPGSPDDTGPGRVLTPVVWALAAGWLVLQALGRTGLWLLTVVDEGTTAVAQGCGGAARALVRALGPLGRALQRALTPLGRALRRAWAWAGRRVFLALGRALGRWARLLVRRLRPLVSGAVRLVRRAAVLAEPVVARLATAGAVIERAATRLGSALRRAWAPWRRATAALVRQVRAVLPAEQGPAGSR
jgi:hypothetical protein